MGRRSSSRRGFSVLPPGMIRDLIEAITNPAQQAWLQRWFDRQRDLFESEPPPLRAG